MDPATETQEGEVMPPGGTLRACTKIEVRQVKNGEDIEFVFVRFIDFSMVNDDHQYGLDEEGNLHMPGLLTVKYTD